MDVGSLGGAGSPEVLELLSVGGGLDIGGDGDSTVEEFSDLDEVLRARLRRGAKRRVEAC